MFFNYFNSNFAFLILSYVSLNYFHSIGNLLWWLSFILSIWIRCDSIVLFWVSINFHNIIFLIIRRSSCYQGHVYLLRCTFCSTLSILVVIILSIVFNSRFVLFVTFLLFDFIINMLWSVFTINQSSTK